MFWESKDARLLGCVALVGRMVSNVLKNHSAFRCCVRLSKHGLPRPTKSVWEHKISHSKCVHFYMIFWLLYIRFFIKLPFCITDFSRKFLICGLFRQLSSVFCQKHPSRNKTFIFCRFVFPNKMLWVLSQRYYISPNLVLWSHLLLPWGLPRIKFSTVILFSLFEFKSLPESVLSVSEMCNYIKKTVVSDFHKYYETFLLNCCCWPLRMQQNSVNLTQTGPDRCRIAETRSYG